MQVATLDRKLDIKLHTPSSLSSAKKDLIVLIGWVGSNYRYLSKYLDIYIDQGYSVLTYIPSPAECFFGYQRSSRASVVLSILHKLLHSQDYTGIVWHIFSNNGGFFFDGCMRLISQYYQPGTNIPIHNDQNVKLPSFSDIRGTIVDSAPSVMKPEVALGAMRHSIPPMLFYIVAFCFIVIMQFIQLKTKLLYSQDMTSLYWNFLGNEKYKWPYLVLYSAKDVIIRPQDIEMFIDKLKRENKQRRVEVHRWEDGGHVQLYKEHKEEYTKQCLDFVQSLQ